MKDKYENLRLKNQLCFPLYACAKEMTRRYKPFLDKIDLTYTQYIAMMVLWEEEQTSVKDLGNALMLDSGTLTPLLKKMEQKGLLTRQRAKIDERVLIVTLTDKGRSLKDEALNVPSEMGMCVGLSPEESRLLYHLLYKVLNNIENSM